MVAAPFPRIAVHVVESPGVGELATDHVERVTGVGDAPGVVAQVRIRGAKEPRPRVVRIVSGRHRARGHLPHRLRGQVERERKVARGGAYPLGERAERSGGSRDIVPVLGAAKRVVADARLRRHVSHGGRDASVLVLHQRILPRRHLIDADVVVLRHRRFASGGILHAVRARRHAPEDHLCGLVHVVRVVGWRTLLVRHAARRKVDDHIRGS